jgi:hypothetical protein
MTEQKKEITVHSNEKIIRYLCFHFFHTVFRSLKSFFVKVERRSVLGHDYQIPERADLFGFGFLGCFVLF